MRGGPAPRAAASSVADVHCAPPSGRSELFLPGTAGDFSLSASLSACTLLYEVPSRIGAGTSPHARRAAQGARAPPSRLPVHRRYSPGAAAPAAQPRLGRGRPCFPYGSEEAASGRWLGARRDPLGSLGSGLSALVPAPQMGHHDRAERSALEPTVLLGAPSLMWRRWTWRAVGRGSGDRIPPTREMEGRAELGHSEGHSPSLGVPCSRCQGAGPCCREPWSLCRLTWTPRRTRRTRPMSTTLWRTPPWYGAWRALLERRGLHGGVSPAGRSRPGSPLPPHLFVTQKLLGFLVAHL